MIELDPLRSVVRRLRYGTGKMRALWTWRRFTFHDSPVVFGNAMPKAGSHLLLQLLEGIQRVAPFAPVRSHPIRTITIDGRTRTSVEIQADLGRLRPGDIAWGYLNGTADIIQSLSKPGWVNFLMIRDPRDLLVSHIFYALELRPEDSMHATYAALPDMDARLAVAIQGTEGYPFLPNVYQRYERRFGFFDREAFHILRFEDFILQPEQTVHGMLEVLAAHDVRFRVGIDQAVAHVLEAVQPKHSPTFRGGKVGEWKRYFSAENLALFDRVCGDLLQRLGYPDDHPR